MLAKLAVAKLLCKLLKIIKLGWIRRKLETLAKWATVAYTARIGRRLRANRKPGGVLVNSRHASRRNGCPYLGKALQAGFRSTISLEDTFC
jgi:hypothetical protein